MATRAQPLAERWLACQIIPLGRGVAPTVRDVTERRRAEEELRGMSSRPSTTHTGAPGRAAGDDALVAMADILRQTFRDTDIVGRLGGDEFVVLAINCGEVAKAVLARLRLEIAAWNLRGEAAGIEYTLSTCVCVARFESAAPKTLGSLLRHADSDLYLDKRRAERKLA